MTDRWATSLVSSWLSPPGLGWFRAHIFHGPVMALTEQLPCRGAAFRMGSIVGPPDIAVEVPDQGRIHGNLLAGSVVKPTSDQPRSPKSPGLTVVGRLLGSYSLHCFPGMKLYFSGNLP